MTDLHRVIIAGDKSVTPVIEPMMGKEMIIYKEQGKIMKYALADTKKYMSLHCLPMYCNPAVHTKYSNLLSAAKFQKGCINFKDAGEMPLSIVSQLIAETSVISIAELLEKRKRK